MVCRCMAWLLFVLLVASCGSGATEAAQGGEPYPYTPPTYIPQPPAEMDETVDETPVVDPVTEPDMPVETPVQVPPVQDGDQLTGGWQAADPDPQWTAAPQPPGIYLFAIYHRHSQQLTVISEHERGTSMMIALELPAGITASCGTAYAVPGRRTTQVHDLKFSSGGPDTGELTITAVDTGGWSASRQLSFMRSVYIESSCYHIAEQLLYIQLNCPPEEEATVTLSPPQGFAVGSPTQSLTGPGWAVFDIIVDPGKAKTWSIVATATDSRGHDDIDNADLWRIPVQYRPDTLHVYPLCTVAKAGDPIPVVVATGSLTAPLCYINGVGVTVKAGADYVANSLNIGAPGGPTATGDGIWFHTAPLPTLFLLADDDIIGAKPSAQTGLVRIDFNVTPVWSSRPEMLPSASHGGVMFNFCLAFDAPGLYTLGIEEFETVKRTYYSDWDSLEYTWSDVTNMHAGVPIKILVTD